jgi:DHA1 family bicyclomycin/chloramphenicol resistance-like MFS transporter
MIRPAAPPPTRPPLWLLVAVTASGTLAMHMLVPALPMVARDLAVSTGSVQLTITAYVAGLAAGQLLYGPISDRVGRRPALIAALLLYALGGLAAAVAQNLGFLVAARILQALGGCGGLVLGRAIVRDVTGAEQAAAQLALLNLAVSAAPALSPIVGSWLALTVGWRAIFVLLAASGAATLVLAALTIPETARTSGSGQVLRSYPRLLAVPAFRWYALGGACLTTSMYAFLTTSPFIFTQTLHRPAGEVGIYYLLLFSGVSIGSLIANRAVRRVSPVRLLRGASLVATMSAATFLAAAATGRLTLGLTLVSLLVFAASAGTASPMALTGAVSVRRDAIGAASGLYGFWQMSYGALCTLVVSLWHDNPPLSAGTVLLGSAVLGLFSVVRATRRGFIAAADG